MKFKSFFGILFLSLFTICCVSCSDDKNEPISFKDGNPERINLWYPDTIAANYELQGGDGNYQAHSSNPEVVQAKITSGKYLTLRRLALGTSVVTITDDSDNLLEVKVNVDYYTMNFSVGEYNVFMVGDLRESEKQEIREEALKTIPVQIGGGYKFVFTNYREDYTGEGKAFIYPKEFGKDGIEGTFEQKLVENIIEEKEYRLTSYYIDIDGEIIELFMDTYRNYVSYNTRDMIVEVAFLQDVTDVFKENYPHVEKVYTLQLLKSAY